MWAEGIPTQPSSGLQAPREAKAGGQGASQAWSVGADVEGSSFQVPPPHPCPTRGWGAWGPEPQLLSPRWGPCHPPPSSDFPGLCSGPAGGTEGVGLGRHQHQISFHLCEDSLTPEHINILNDRERSWDSRQPMAPSSSPYPSSPHSLFLLSFLPYSLPPPSISLLSPSCLSVSSFLSSFFLLCLAIFPGFSFSFLSIFSPLPSPPLFFLSQDPTALVHSQTFTPKLEWVRLGQSLCLSIPSWAPLPFLGGSKHRRQGPHSGAQREASEPATTAQRHPRKL